jgi:hypothetical protein
MNGAGVQLGSAAAPDWTGGLELQLVAKVLALGSAAFGSLSGQVGVAGKGFAWDDGCRLRWSFAVPEFAVAFVMQEQLADVAKACFCIAWTRLCNHGKASVIEMFALTQQVLSPIQALRHGIKLKPTEVLELPQVIEYLTSSGLQETRFK